MKKITTQNQTSTMTTKEIFNKVAISCYSVLENMDQKVDPSMNNNIARFDINAFCPEKLTLKKYWIVMRCLKQEGLLNSMLRLELQRLFYAIDDTHLFMKLLGLITVTLYAIDTPEAITAAEKCYGYVSIE